MTEKGEGAERESKKKKQEEKSKRKAGGTNKKKFDTEKAFTTFERLLIPPEILQL